MTIEAKKVQATENLTHAVRAIGSDLTANLMGLSTDLQKLTDMIKKSNDATVRLAKRVHSFQKYGTIIAAFALLVAIAHLFVD